MIEVNESGQLSLDAALEHAAWSEPAAPAPVQRRTARGLSLRLRRSRPGDEAGLATFFGALSRETVYRRFLTPRRRFPPEFLAGFICGEDGRQEIQLALAGPADRARIVGIGQFACTEGHCSADAALVVRDEFHRRGVGTVLLRHLIDLARGRGHDVFRAEVLPGNWPLLRLLAHLGLDLEARHEQGLILLSAHFR